MGKALYRTYRSKSLDEVIGQEHITSVLKNAIKAKRFSHAYLLTGPRGVGKTSVARILAHAINDIPYTDESTHLDIIEIDAASNRRIDDIRELREKVHMTPVSSPYKVYIIDEVHMLTTESFNALLKTLEEPPAHVIFILATTELHKLPATIVSRTQRYGFRLIEPIVMRSHLRSIADSEKLVIDDETLDLIAEHGEGTVRDSISLLDQLASVGDKKITTELVEQTIGLAPKKLLDALITAIQKKESTKARDVLTTFEQTGVPPTIITRQLTRELRIRADEHSEFYHLIDELIDVPRSYDPRLKLLTTVLLHTLPRSKSHTEKTIAAKVTKESPVMISALPIRKKPVEKLQNIETSLQEKKLVVGAGSITNEQWNAVLAHIKIEYPPLYSVIKYTSPEIIKNGTVLVLSSPFALHAKKLDDPRYRSTISAIIAKICAVSVEILIKTDISLKVKKTDDDASQITPVVEPNSQTASVIAMMGGGEPVNAS